MENSILHAKKLGLPEIILPNDVRNDLYVNIVQGKLTKGKYSLKLLKVRVSLNQKTVL